MKCVKSSSGKIDRVKDDIAFSRVKSGKWNYCGKSEWKTSVRDINKVDEEKKTTKKGKKKNESKDNNGGKS